MKTLTRRNIATVRTLTFDFPVVWLAFSQSSSKTESLIDVPLSVLTWSCQKSIMNSGPARSIVTSYALPPSKSVNITVHPELDKVILDDMNEVKVSCP